MKCSPNSPLEWRILIKTILGHFELFKSGDVEGPVAY
jgi:hypothetical protein